MHLKEHFAEAISCEAIAYQGTSVLKHDMTYAFRTFIEGGKFTQAILDTMGLSEIVRKHTGLNVEFKVVSDLNAYAIPPVIDVNSPLLSAWRAYGVGEEDLGSVLVTLKKIKGFSDTLNGSIDRGRGRVTGVFSNIVTTVSVGTGLWTQANLTPEEVTAVMLHELGHIYSFFETLVYSATTNMTISSAAQALAKIDKDEDRLTLVHETAKILGAKVEDPAALARKGLRKETFAVIFLKASMDSDLRATHGSFRYDMRSSEFLADQFAARYGAGRDLVVGLDKMMRAMGVGHRYSLPTFMFIQAVQVAWLLVFTVFATPMAILAVLLYTLNPHIENKMYDDPAERLARIKQDLVQSLKDTSLPPKVRQQLLDDIHSIDKVREGVVDRRGLFNYCWLMLTSSRREQYSQMKSQQELERLVNNDLFVKAAQFKTMI